jgi:hypothetical protein
MIWARPETYVPCFIPSSQFQLHPPGCTSNNKFVVEIAITFSWMVFNEVAFDRVHTSDVFIRFKFLPPAEGYEFVLRRKACLRLRSLNMSVIGLCAFHFGDIVFRCFGWTLWAKKVEKKM